MFKSYKERTMASSNQGGGNKEGGNKGNSQSGDTSNRGFASMDPERQREIASEGGRAAHASGNAHEFTSEEARKAGSMSHKNDGNRQSGSQGSGGGGGGGGNNAGSGGGTRGGTPEQHAQAGRQSHKNDDKR
jgi:general stress protein YciG